MPGQDRSTSDPTAPLWHAAQVFRLLSYLYALGFQVASNTELDRPVLSGVLFAALSVWTLIAAVAYLKGFGRRKAWVFAEIGIVVALMLATKLVASDQWALDNQSWPTTLWATNAVISAAILLGPVYGMATGLAVMLTSAILKGHISVDLARNATVIVELAVGLVVGMAASTARRSHTELERAVRLSAAVQERERLARQVHDGVIQVLAYVAKRGREIGGATIELAELAGEQEGALRRLVTAPEAVGGGHIIDLRSSLSRLASDRVSLSMPPTEVQLDSVIATELDAAVVNALDNVRAHAGPDARAYLLLEDLGDSVTVSIRDDGVGIAPGRLDQAAAQGHIGISKSIVGRLQALSGSARLSTDSSGTEWELTVPRLGDRRG